MHNELNRVANKPKYKEINCDHKSSSEQSRIWADYFKERDDSIITDIFEGQLCGTIQCKKCGFKSFSFDNFMDLSVSIPRQAYRITGYIDLKKCIETYTKKELMDPCGYKCQNCKAVDCMEKDMTIYRFP
jgi:ubiquitin C-terminal hydrolase